MPGERHIQTLYHFCEDVHQNWRGYDLSEYDLHDAYLRRAHLKGACLDRCKLREANLSGAHLEGASLVEAEMSGANLRARSKYARGGSPVIADPQKRNPCKDRTFASRNLNGAGAYGSLVGK